MTNADALAAAARKVTPAAPAVAHAWHLMTRGIDVGWLDDGELTELEEHLRARRDFGVEELLFAHLGDDKLRVSLLDDDIECDARELLDALSSFIRSRSENG